MLLALASKRAKEPFSTAGSITTANILNSSETSHKVSETTPRRANRTPQFTHTLSLSLSLFLSYPPPLHTPKMSKPVIVIVPGSWQKPVAYTVFVQKLQAAGYEATHVAMPTVGGTELPLAGLAEDVAAVRTVLQKIAGEGKKALVIGHSSGGLVGSNAIAGQDNVVGMIYLSAFMIPAGKALLDMLGGVPLPWMNIQVSDPIADMAFFSLRLLDC